MADNKEKIQLAFASIDKRWEELIPQLTEVDNVKDYILYGKDNLYPQYLYSLYNDVSTLKTIIEGTAEYVIGNDIEVNIPQFQKEVNTKGDTIRELVRLLARDYLLYGGYAVQIIRNKVGAIRELFYLDFRYIRSSKKNDLFYYSEEFDKKYVRKEKMLVLPKFIPEDLSSPISVLYVTNEKSKTYPTPRYSGALKSIEIEKQISDYHLAALSNGFNGSYIINFLNGIPTDEVKWQLEKDISEKFCGSSNAGRILLNFANGKDNATTVDKLDVEDYGTKYETLAKWSKDQIFTAFQAQPILFGCMKENNGFSQDEYLQAFALYNRTIVHNIATKIIESFDKIFGVENSIKIIPFSIEAVK